MEPAITLFSPLYFTDSSGSSLSAGCRKLHFTTVVDPHQRAVGSGQNGGKQEIMLTETASQVTHIDGAH